MDLITADCFANECACLLYAPALRSAEERTTTLVNQAPPSLPSLPFAIVIRSSATSTAALLVFRIDSVALAQGVCGRGRARLCDQ